MVGRRTGSSEDFRRGGLPTGRNAAGSSERARYLMEVVGGCPSARHPGGLTRHGVLAQRMAPVSELRLWRHVWVAAYQGLDVFLDELKADIGEEGGLCMASVFHLGGVDKLMERVTSACR